MKTNILKVVFLIIILAITIKIVKAKSNVGNYLKSTPLNTIVGGGNYPDQSNPPMWIGAMYIANIANPLCTVEFISNLYILTAYHCIAGVNLQSLSVAYLERNNDGYFIYPKIGIQSYVRYKNNYDIVIAKLTTPYPAPIEPLIYYHGFDFEKTKDKRYYPITLFGYGGISDFISMPPVKNVHSMLKQLTGNIVDVFHDPAYLMILPDLGLIAGGDSGGATIVNTVFNNRAFRTIVGINIEVAAPYIYSIWLNNSILAWIADKTDALIFKTPTNNQLILNNDDKISFTGWGRVPAGSTIIVYNSQSIAVAHCEAFSSIGSYAFNGAQWQCTTTINDTYNNPSDIYQARIYVKSVNSLQIDDVVEFRMSRYGQNLKITHPDKNNGIFTYHTPYKSTYLIMGEGTPGDTLNYELKRESTNITFYNDYPCENESATKPIPNTGIWKCRIRVFESANLTYQLTVKVTNNRNTDNKTRIATIVYNVYPNLSTPYIRILSPQSNDTITTDRYTITTNFNKANTARRLIYQINLFGYNLGHITSTAENSTQHELIVPNEVSKWTIPYLDLNNLNVTLSVAMYIDNDDEPIAESQIYFNIIPSLIQIESPLNVSVVLSGTKLEITGKATPKSLVNVITTPQSEFNCKIKSDTHGKWSCHTNLDTSSLGMNTFYSLTANLLKAMPDNTESILTSDTKQIYIYKQDPVVINNP